jgi:hypothetical protein
VLHRDIKPSNVVVRPDGSPALVDFGSVRRIFRAAEESGSTVAGTYGYMPFEQYMGQASPASDFFALGATLLHLVTGRPPRDFVDADGQIAVPDELPGDARLRPIIARMLRPSPAERFATAAEIRHALLAPPLLPAVFPTPSVTRARPVGRTAPDPSLLLPIPRPIEGATAALLERVAPTAWELMDTSSKPTDEVGILDVVSLVVFSIATAGILPLVFFTMARARRRRLRRFFREGIPALAEVLSIRPEPAAFARQLARVTYEFEVDRVVHRDTDSLLPAVADRWQPGDRLQILYLPESDFDSVIVSPR